MRAKKGAARTRAKKRLFNKVEGFVGGRRRLLKTAKETLLRAGMFAFRDRRAKKRDFRRLFITRLSAAAEMRGHALQPVHLRPPPRLVSAWTARACPTWRSSTPKPSTRSSPWPGSNSTRPKPR